jgi:hypothetical protein
MEIIDNLIKKEDLKNIKEILESSNFPWYLNKAVEHLSIMQFTHEFYYRDGTTSKFIETIHPILKKIPACVYFRIKANLNTKTENIIETGDHTDLNDKRFKSSIFFVNDCDGYCRIADEKYYSKSNRLLTFDPDLIHTGSSTTNAKCRLLINFIYLPKND